MYIYIYIFPRFFPSSIFSVLDICYFFAVYSASIDRPFLIIQYSFDSRYDTTIYKDRPDYKDKVLSLSRSVTRKGKSSMRVLLR